MSETISLLRMGIGPAGTNVMLDKGKNVEITNDAKMIVDAMADVFRKDRFAAMGHGRIKGVCDSTNDRAGDGRKTTALIFDSVYKAGMRDILAGANPNDVAAEIRKTGGKAASDVEKMAVPITKAQWLRVASISAESEEMGKVVADTIGKVGLDGHIKVEESDIVGLSMETTKGFEFARGFLANFMITDHDAHVAEMKDADILIVDHKIEAFRDFKDFLTRAIAAGKKRLVIVAEDFDDSFLVQLGMNQVAGVSRFIAVRAPGYGPERREFFEDLSTVTGATIVSSGTGDTLDKTSVKALGSAASVSCTRDTTTVVGGKGRLVKAVADSILKESARPGVSLRASESLRRRAAALTGKAAVIRVGTLSPRETTYKRRKIQDAIAATRAAIRHGIVPGGGAALLHVQHLMQRMEHHSMGDAPAGRVAVINALSAPFLAMYENSSGDGMGAYHAGIIKSTYKLMTGFDFSSREIANMNKAGIVDAAEISASAIRVACEEAAMLLTTGAGIALDSND